MATKEDTIEMIRVMQAFVGGKAIQRMGLKDPDIREWDDMPIAPIWNWAKNDYRIKPEPREFWVNFYPNLEGMYWHKSKESADRKLHSGGTTIKVKEVIDE